MSSIEENTETKSRKAKENTLRHDITNLFSKSQDKKNISNSIERKEESKFKSIVLLNKSY